jgi:hypothetical protein
MHRCAGVAEQLVKAHDPEGWGCCSTPKAISPRGWEAASLWFAFVVREGLYRRSECYVVPGISRQMRLDLTHQLGIPAIEGDIDLWTRRTPDRCS